MRDIYVVLRDGEVVAAADDFDRASMVMAGAGLADWVIVNVDLFEEGD
jgi:hypothetical protein